VAQELYRRQLRFEAIYDIMDQQSKIDTKNDKIAPFTNQMMRLEGLCNEIQQIEKKPKLDPQDTFGLIQRYHITGIPEMHQKLEALVKDTLSRERHPQSAYTLAVFMRNQKRFELMNAAIEKVIERLPPNIPNAGPMFLEIAEMAATGLPPRIDLAERALDGALASGDTNLPPTKLESIMNTFMRAGDIQASIKPLQILVKTYPNAYHAWLRISFIHLLGNRLPEAYAAADQALKTGREQALNEIMTKSEFEPLRQWAQQRMRVLNSQATRESGGPAIPINVRPTPGPASTPPVTVGPPARPGF
jgi:tetratricopeptide (TPR) repeat protein